jgi:basic membrane protein A
MTTFRLPRIRLAVALGCAATLLLAGCSSSNATTDGAGADAGDEVLQVAALTPGQTNDGSFNQRALEALQKLADEGRIEFELREGMASPTDSEPVIRDFASQGYDLIIGHGLELADPIFAVAEEFPDVHFTASGGPDVLDRATDNVETWTYDSTEVGYLTGYLAGLSGISPIGLVDSLDLPFVVATDNGFRAGVAETNPDAEILPSVYAGSFDDAQAASQAADSLLSQGAKLLFTTGDGIGAGVASAADEGGAYTFGVSLSAGEIADRVNVATVDIDLYPQFAQWVEDVEADEFGSEGNTSTIANGGVVASDVNPVVPDLEAAQAELDSLIEGLADGSRKLPGAE